MSDKVKWSLALFVRPTACMRLNFSLSGKEQTE